MAMQQGAKVSLRELDVNHQQRKKRKYRWLVESRIEGKRARKFFRHGEKSQAESFKAELERQVSKVSESNRALLDEKLLTEAVEVSKRLATFGRTLTDAAEFYIAHLEAEANQDKMSLNEAIDFYLAEVESYGIKPDTIKRYRETLNRLRRAFTDRTVGSLTGTEIKAWWETFGSIPNQRANRTDVNVFFNWLVKSDRFPNITSNPVPPPPRINKNTKYARQRVILTADDVDRILNVCEHELLPLVVAQIFIGVRPEESLRLDWSHFDFEAHQLNISADIAKGGAKHARINPIPPNALKWLEPYSQNESGKVLPNVYSKSAFDKRLRKLRADAGWNPGEWPQNALRKTFISCHYAANSNVGLTASIAGTSETVIFDTYRAVVKKTTALKLLEIEPT